MNAVLSHVLRHRDRLGLDWLGPAERLSSVLLTPRFRASAHVVVLVLSRPTSRPVLVLKASRLPGPCASLARENDNLRALETAWPESLGSVPRPLAHESCGDHSVLVETVVRGRTLKPSLVRRQRVRSTRWVLRWLEAMNVATLRRDVAGDEREEVLLLTPLDRLEACLAATGLERDLLARTRELTTSARVRSLPAVFEHGDFSSPNLLVSEGRRLGVVDWELGEPRGLPGHDLFFVLGYLAFARRGARGVNDRLAAFRSAFFGREAWAVPYIQNYAERLGIESAALPALFLACWSRYLAGLAERVDANAENAHAERTSAEGTRLWLRANRYFELWRYTVQHFDELVIPRGRGARGAGVAGGLEPITISP